MPLISLFIFYPQFITTGATAVAEQFTYDVPEDLPELIVQIVFLLLCVIWKIRRW